MRPATRFILSAPFGDFPFVKRMLPECKRLLPSWPDDLVVSLMKLICLEISDRMPDADFLQYISRYRGYSAAEIQETILKNLVEKEIYQSERNAIPIYTSTSTYWKSRTYGLVGDQRTTEASTERAGW